MPPVALPPWWTHGVEEVVGPLMYGRPHGGRTRCPRRNAKLLQALAAVAATVATHPMPQQRAPEVLTSWQAGAAEQAKAWQRASAAVEGRNGSWSQRHHHHRGVPTPRYKAWTVRHNVDCRAAEGTPPASRLFRRGFPDLFETVLSTIDAVPRPRQRHQALAIRD